MPFLAGSLTITIVLCGADRRFPGCCPEWRLWCIIKVGPCTLLSIHYCCLSSRSWSASISWFSLCVAASMARVDEPTANKTVANDCDCIGCGEEFTFRNTWNVSPRTPCEEGQLISINSFKVATTDGSGLNVHLYDDCSGGAFYPYYEESSVTCLNRGQQSILNGRSFCFAYECKNLVYSCPTKESLSFSCLYAACSSLKTCSQCRTNTLCGWCASTGTCVGGAEAGPTSATCATGSWYYAKCPSTPTPTPTPGCSPRPQPAPVPTPTPTRSWHSGALATASASLGLVMTLLAVAMM
ncbi:hypothetical protein PAPYR_3312 [Paratrimastix pyriformis]|uniref:PSI domain-containing protein n=1 Tax=Paratrimastix pyriformis TaxID=342808 RepID=A0ABQ8UU97_9EUKA|nr:hypothetical protein PAPYR_3312 [Paratrimastix pyriformis]